MQHIKKAIDLFLEIVALPPESDFDIPDVYNDAFEALLGQFKTFTLPTQSPTEANHEAERQEVLDLLRGNLSKNGNELYALCIKWPPEIAEALLPVYMMRYLLGIQMRSFRYVSTSSNFQYFYDGWSKIIL